MSIVEMRKVSLVAEGKERDAILSTLQEAGVMHISPLPAKKSVAIKESSISDSREKIDKLNSILRFLAECGSRAEAIPPKVKDNHELMEQVSALYYRYQKASQDITDLKQDIELYSPFGNFDVSAQSLKDVGISIKLAILEDASLNALAKTHSDFSVIKKIDQKNYVAIFIEGDKKISIPVFDPPPLSVSIMRDRVAALEKEANEIKKAGSAWLYQERTIITMRDRAADFHARLLELKKASFTGDFFGVSGYVLAKQVDILKRALLKHYVALKIDKPAPNSDVPVELKNPQAIKGFESIVRAFTGINYFEKDKTFIVSLLFMFFGALCLLDAGYGLLLLITGYVVGIKKNRDFGQVFMWTGAFSLILGAMCGQIFGLVFAKDILLNIPPLFTLATDPMICFIFSLLVGLGAMPLTNLVAIYQNGPQTNATGSLIAILGLATLAVKKFQVIESDFYDVDNILFYVSSALFSLALLSWLLFPDPVFGPKSKAANVMWTLYSGPVGIAQDVLSHMRLFGIALSGSILALVINKISAMMPLAFGALFAPLGHFFVFLLALLSLYIHTNRLIFLEFGSKCMNGGNNYFTPFARRQ